jgi:hypothetical protein
MLNVPKETLANADFWHSADWRFGDVCNCRHHVGGVTDDELSASQDVFVRRTIMDRPAIIL